MRRSVSKKKKNSLSISHPTRTSHVGHISFSQNNGFQARNLPPELQGLFHELNAILTSRGFQGIKKSEAQYLLEVAAQQLQTLDENHSSENKDELLLPPASPTLTKGQSDRLDKSVKKLQKKAKKKEKTAQQVQQLEEMLRVQKEQHLDEISRKEKLIKQLEKNNVEIEEQLEEQVKVFQEEIQRREKLLEDLTDSKNALEKEFLEELDEKMMEITSLDQSLTEHQERNRFLQLQNDALVKKLETEQEICSELFQQLQEAIQKEKGSYLLEMNGLEGFNHELDENLCSILKKELLHLHSELKKKRQSEAQLQIEVQKLNRTVRQLTTQLKEKDEIIQNSQQLLEELKGKTHKAVIQEKNQRQINETLESQLRRLRDELNLTKNKLNHQHSTGSMIYKMRRPTVLSNESRVQINMTEG